MSILHGITIKKEPHLYENFGTENLHDDEDPGSRCGEIYVGNNANKWTFICTFCDKSVREIDEFIMHIKYAHVNLPPPLPVEQCEQDHHLDDPIEHRSPFKDEVPSIHPLDKHIMPEFVDYNDFLDVNVQTVPEVIMSDNNDRKDTPFPPEEQNGLRIRIKTEPGMEKQVMPRNKHTKQLPMHFPRVVLPPSMSMAIVRQPESKPRQRQRNKKGRSRRKQIKGPAFCQICKRTFQYHSLYRNHMVKHTSETPFTCTICKKGFKSKQAIRYHMTTHQREKNFQCELCEASFHHEWQFVTHMETHRSENNHPCEVCGKVNRTKFEKEVHMRTHTGDRPFACEFCLKRFRLRHHLSNHLKLHFTYRCDFCRQQFSNSVPLKKPYACPDCNVDSNIEQSPAFHNKQEAQQLDATESGDEAADVTFHPIHSSRDAEALSGHSCKICHKTYANQRGLSVHFSTKHLKSRKN